MAYPCLVGNIQEKFHKNRSTTFISEGSPASKDLPSEAVALAPVFGWPSGNSLSVVVGADPQLNKEERDEH